jgi:diketogulonate reductase-like aldo/keto reductase
VSNFDTRDMEELAAVPAGDRVAANQVLYNLARRGPEHDLFPWCARRGIDIMAYSPLDEGPLAGHPVVVEVATRLGILPAQVAIAWILRNPLIAVIPKASRPEHVRANAACRAIALDAQAIESLDSAFPAPRSKRPLEMI